MDYLEQNHPYVHCIFVNVAILTEKNFPVILADFLLILDKMALL
ncbi:hypothetical protein RintRC_0699 [Richelia intracellularis]|nr:hypothetical protein RintRC_0699 [Richelia intracellularis]